jgi:hypothetical protein
MHLKAVLSSLILAGLAVAPFAVQAAPNGTPPAPNQLLNQSLGKPAGDPGQPAFAGTTSAPPSPPPGTTLSERPGVLGTVASTYAPLGVSTGNNSQGTQPIPAGQEIIQAGQQPPP